MGATERSPDNWERVQQSYMLLEGANLDNDFHQERSLVKLEAFILKLRTEFAHCHPDADSAERIAKLLLEFVGTSTLRQTFSSYQRESDFERVWCGFVTLLKECAEHSSSWTEVLDEFEGIGQVSLMTVHKSKGLEYHTMIFYGLDDETWWSLQPRKVEELKTFFVAFTRAKQRAFFLQCNEQGRAIDWLAKLLAQAGVETIDGTTILSIT